MQSKLVPNIHRTPSLLFFLKTWLYIWLNTFTSFRHINVIRAGQNLSFLLIN